MGSVGNQTTSGEGERVVKVVNFGNGSYMKETVSYKGVQMTREEARRIDKIKDDLGYFSYRSVRTPLSEAQLREQEELQNELRRYRKKYGNEIGGSMYLPGGR